MESQTVTYHVKLVAKCSDGMGYINYVFEDLEFQDYDYKYIMCVRFPNWEQTSFDLDDEGFVTVKYVREGIDEWYDGNNFIKYKDTNIIFIKFIHKKEKVIPIEIKLD